MKIKKNKSTPDYKPFQKERGWNNTLWERVKFVNLGTLTRATKRKQRVHDLYEVHYSRLDKLVR